MNVLHINTHDSGGAFNAVISLQNSLNKSQNIESKVLVLYKSNHIPNVFGFLNESSNSFVRSFRYRIKNTFNVLIKTIYNLKNTDFSFVNSVFDITEHSLYTWADVIHIHWYHGFLDLPSFVEKNIKPVVFTLHDENLFLGGFHYAFDRENIGKEISLLESTQRKIKLKSILKIRKKAIISPSRWLYNKCLYEFKGYSHHIPNVINHTIFYEEDKFQCKKELNIPTDKIVFLTIAEGVEKKRKGITKLINLFLNENFNILLLVVGDSNKLYEGKNLRHLGYIEDKNMLRKVYNATDLYICPSEADNSPNTVLEALFCGTPSIGFNVGGIPELIISNQLVCSEINHSLLIKKGVEYLLNNLNTLDQNLIEIKRKFDPQNALNRHIELYYSLYEHE